MLSLEIILVLGGLYSFLIYAMVKTQRENREERAGSKIREQRVALGNSTPEGTRHEVVKESA